VRRCAARPARPRPGVRLDGRPRRQQLLHGRRCRPDLHQGGPVHTVHRAYDDDEDEVEMTRSDRGCARREGRA
jgi:hypothetical protein